MPKAVTLTLRIVLLLLTLLEGLTMAGSGAAKFYAQIWHDVFVIWGLPMWFMYTVGVLEAVGGVSLFVPKAAAWGGVGLMVIMVSAVITTGVHPIPAQRFTWGAPAIHVCLLGVIVALRWKERWIGRVTVPG